MQAELLEAKGQLLQPLHLDEKVEWLWERAEPVEGKGSHWKQHVQLVRDGRMRHFIAEMGSIIAHPHWQEFNFWAASEYSVGECLEIAEGLRNNKDPEQYEPINLAQSYLKLLEEKAKRRAHASTSGNYINRQRG